MCCLLAEFGRGLWGPWEPGLMRQMVLCTALLCNAQQRGVAEQQSRRRGVRQRGDPALRRHTLHGRVGPVQPWREPAYSAPVLLYKVSGSRVAGRPVRCQWGGGLPRSPASPHRTPTNLHHCTTLVPFIFTRPINMFSAFWCISCSCNYAHTRGAGE